MRAVIGCQRGSPRVRHALVPVVVRMRLVATGAVGAVLVTCAVVAAPAPQAKLDQVVSRLGTYLADYEHRFSLVVAEERYQQSVEVAKNTPAGNIPPGTPVRSRQDRSLRSDYALTRAADKEAWVGYRDTFEVDGHPVRDRDDRLQRTLIDGIAARAVRIAEESSRFNLGSALLERNINVPTLALEMLHPRNQSRFSFSKAGEERIAATLTWRVDFKERDRPTFIRNTSGRDRPSRGSIWLDPSTGEVWRTLLAWDGPPSGMITVAYGYVPNIDVLVPLTMTERYRPGNATITGDAAYSNYRRFQTGARLVTHP
jgi:hypothetical protein